MNANAWRRSPLALLCAVGAAALALAACGGDDEADAPAASSAAAPAAESTAAATSAESAASAPATSAAAPSGEKVKVAAVFTVPLEQQWASVIHKALTDAEAAGQIEYAVSESTPPEDTPKVVRQYAADGYDLVVIESYHAEDDHRAAASEFGDTAFLLGSSLPVDEAYPNVAVFGTHVEEAAYVCGMQAGAATKTNKLGFIGGFPIPEINWEANAFIDGARYINPEVEYVTTFINSFFDPPKTKEATLAQIEAGVDVVFAERSPAVETAAEKKVFAVGNIVDIGQQYPDTVLCSALWNMEPTIQAAIANVQAGTFKAEDYSPYIAMKAGGNTPAPFHGSAQPIPAEAQAKIDARTQEIVDGAFAVEANSDEPKSG